MEEIKDINMFNKLPYFVILQGRKYKINVDFRNMISYEKIILDKTISKAEKIKKGLQLFYPFFCNEENYMELVKKIELYKEACEKLIWFYKCGREDYHKSSNQSGNVNFDQIFSYEYDDEYIYGAFYEQYRIDLSYQKVHWWKFRALMKSLKDNTQFEKIKSYRAYKGEDENMKKLKEYWKLPIETSEQKRLDALYEKYK